jgi:hypothetical protein
MTPRAFSTDKPHIVKAAYKPYSIKDFRDKFNNEKQELKGLGANIGTKDWVEREKKKDKMVNYAKVVKKKAADTCGLEATAKFGEKTLINNLKPIGKVTEGKEVKSKKGDKNYLNDSEDMDDSMLYDILESKVDYKVIAKEYNAKINKQLNNEQKEREKTKEELVTPVRPAAVVEDDHSRITDDKSALDVYGHNKSGYSHIHQIRKLKSDVSSVKDSVVTASTKPINKGISLAKISNTSHTTSVKSDRFLRAKSSFKVDDSRSKVYTTLNHHPPVIKKEISTLDKIRALSSKPKKKDNIPPPELDNLIQNHLYYKDKVENIRKFINKI